jgi:hypothetical protein
MDPDRQREISSMGGKANQNRHKFTSEEARVARKKGGMVRGPSKQRFGPHKRHNRP